MTKEEFVNKMLENQMYLQLAIFEDDYDEIERLSIKIGKLISRYLGERKLYVEK